MSDAFPDKIGAFWDKRDAFLDKLYNPAQLSDSDDRWVRSAALLAGLPETPGKRMEAELRRGELKPIPNLIDRIRQATKVDCGTPTGKVSPKLVCGRAPVLKMVKYLCQRLNAEMQNALDRTYC